MRIGIGVGIDKDEAKAAVQAVRQAKRAVPKPDLALAFGTVTLDQRRIHQALCSELDPAILLGGSSYAEITNAGVTKGSVNCLLISFDGAKPQLADVDLGDDPFTAAKRLAGSLIPGKRPLGLLFTSLGTGKDNDAIRGLADGLGGAALFGGMTAGNYDLGLSDPDFWSNYQYAGPRLTRRAARCALLDMPAGEWNIGFGFEHGWQPVAPPVKVTRADGSRVLALDGMPVLDYYRQFIGDQGGRAFFEKMIQRYGISLQLEGRFKSRSLLKLPVACDFKKGSIDFYPSEPLEGRRVQLIQASRLGLVEGARQAALRCKEALDGREPALVLMMSCCTRNWILHSRMDTELDAVRSVFGPKTPVFGYYTGGEIVPFLNRYEDAADFGKDFGGSYYHTTTVGLLALAPSRAPSKVSVPKAANFLNDDPARLRQQLARSEEVLDATEGFLANLSRKTYLDSEKLRRQSEVIHRYTPHEVWKRAGETAERGDYEVPESEFHGAFMFMDVKGFTTFSETHGPAEVVKALNQLFDPATRAIYEFGGDVDKYIGDCIFAAFPDSAKAVDAASAILKRFEELKAAGHPFSVRIGINSGRAIRANVGSSDRREYTFIGDAVNLAQRLESNATPGGMLLAEEVYKAASAPFSSAEKKVLTVKGRTTPVVAYDCRP